MNGNGCPAWCDYTALIDFAVLAALVGGVWVLSRLTHTLRELRDTLYRITERRR